jgi:hypothetical protein
MVCILSRQQSLKSPELIYKSFRTANIQSKSIILEARKSTLVLMRCIILTGYLEEASKRTLLNTNRNPLIILQHIDLVKIESLQPSKLHIYCVEVWSTADNALFLMERP